MTTPTQTPELKACPFCGSKPYSGWQGNNVPGMEDCGYWAISCCHADVHEESQEQAAFKWNTRALPSKPSELVELAKDCDMVYRARAIAAVSDRDMELFCCSLDILTVERFKALKEAMASGGIPAVAAALREEGL